MELGTELMEERALQDLDRRVTTLEAEHSERWKAQFALNKDVKKAITDLVTSVTAGRIKWAVLFGFCAAGGAGLTNLLT